MINYDKLKIAHELCLNTEYGFIHKILYEQWNNNNLHQVFEIMHPLDGLICSYDIDDIISKLKELTEEKLKPKYEVGQTVWHLLHEEIHEGVIKEIDITPDGMYRDYDFLYIIGSDFWSEEQLYLSKEALIEAQIKYWQELKRQNCLPNDFFELTAEDNKKLDSLLAPEIWLDRLNQYRKDKELAEKSGSEVKDICVHESDGHICSYSKTPSIQKKYRCKKCGEIYK